MHKHRGVGWIVLTLFFCSGATALVYEVVWSKYLSQMFGSTIQAQTVVLAVFMGGLALGNRFSGDVPTRCANRCAPTATSRRRLDCMRSFFRPFINLADRIFVSFGSRVLEQSGLLLSLKQC